MPSEAATKQEGNVAKKKLIVKPSNWRLIEEFATTLKDGELKRRFQQLAARYRAIFHPQIERNNYSSYWGSENN